MLEENGVPQEYGGASNLDEDSEVIRGQLSREITRLRPGGEINTEMERKVETRRVSLTHRGRNK